MSENPETPQPEQSAPFVPPTPEELESLLPHYEIRQLIAHGGMGAVYSGVQRDLERPVAIKVLPPDAGRDNESIDRFRTEARAMARLTHPHIPAVFDFTVVQEFCVLVMELVEGPNIYTLIRQGQLPPDQALEALAQVCDAVQFAHTRGIVHGDIKPGNILLNQDGMVKLADFGLARLMGQHARDAETWTPMGTPEYAAPELYDKNAAPDHRADVYSLGVVLHEMLTGTPPAGEFELPAEAMGLDPRIDEIIARCMELNPENRYQSAQEVRLILREVIDHRNVPPPPPVKAPARRIFRATRRMPAGVKKPKAASQKAAPKAPPATQRGTPAASQNVTRPGGTRGRPAKRVRKIVVMDGAGRSRGGASEGAKRGLLVGAALIIIAIAVWLILTKDRGETPVEPKKKAASAESNSSANSPAEAPPPPTPPVTTPPKTTPALVAPKLTPDAAPAAAPTADTALAKIRELRGTWRGEWNTKVESKISDALTRLSGHYGLALQKLEESYDQKGDREGVQTVRAEVDRFGKTYDPVAPADLSKNAEIAKLQQTLNGEVDKLRAGVKYDADSVKEKYMLALKALEKEMDDAQNTLGSKAVSDEFEKVAGKVDAGLKNYFNAE